MATYYENVHTGALMAIASGSSPIAPNRLLVPAGGSAECGAPLPLYRNSTGLPGRDGFDTYPASQFGKHWRPVGEFDLVVAHSKECDCYARDEG